MAGAIYVTLSVDTNADEAVCEFDVIPPETDYVVELFDVTDAMPLGQMTLDSVGGNHRVYGHSAFGATSGHTYRGRDDSG